MLDISTSAQEIGAAVRTARKEYLLTQQQLAELAGLSDRTVREIEKGTGTPGLKAVLTVLAVLGLKIEVAE
ncbi:type II toxin-antitoxin system Y4mF family antitoxin [Corynebacterium lowii]|uniref:Helix-turn-helix protein n=1 Tax=Corynebacterium lowii TaxID=1544413 RepID=A0A0Q1ABF2_9CORY|nr:type II toxin-antitoxin system Y4mF family antitoxin [Corynebacterium lowii]KQB84015.1 helix-turn-helix protein [Corynebacterium lowii]MDP9852735.1 y4mF family transcriptional regulator [Corynebacterium lowii]